MITVKMNFEVRKELLSRLHYTNCDWVTDNYIRNLFRKVELSDEDLQNLTEKKEIQDIIVTLTKTEVEYVYSILTALLEDSNDNLVDFCNELKTKI